MITACIVKDYTIKIDGKNHRIKNEKLVGSFTNIADLDFKENVIYFRGVVFDYRGNGIYDIGGTVELTKKEFHQKVESWTDIF